MGKSSRRNSAGEQTEETATEDIDDDSRKREAKKRPVLMCESIDALTRYSAESPRPTAIQTNMPISVATGSSKAAWQGEGLRHRP
jgi:hypothetical protein